MADLVRDREKKPKMSRKPSDTITMEKMTISMRKTLHLKLPGDQIGGLSAFVCMNKREVRIRLENVSGFDCVSCECVCV